jgi:hypothetical protein
MSTPEQTPDLELEAQELTDEDLDQTSGGIQVYLAAISDLEGFSLTNGHGTGGHGGDGSAGGAGGAG